MADGGGDRGAGRPDPVGADAGQRRAGVCRSRALSASPGPVRPAWPRPWWPRYGGRLGVPVVVRYTSTETSLGTGTTLTSSDEEVATTVGRPVPGVELAIVDDEGDPVPAGSVGRVLLRSAAAMRGYWGRGPGRGRTVGRAHRPDCDGSRGGRGRVVDHR